MVIMVTYRVAINVLHGPVIGRIGICKWRGENKLIKVRDKVVRVCAQNQ